MSKSVFGIATTQGQAERIVQQLEAQGFATSEISVLMPDTGGTRDIGHVKATKARRAQPPAQLPVALQAACSDSWQGSVLWQFPVWVHSSPLVQLWRL